MEEGTHAGVITGIVDLGKQAGITRPGLTIKDAYKVALIISFPDQTGPDGNPMTVTMTETNSMAPKANLKRFVEQIFGKAFPSQEAADDFDIEKLLGRAGLFSIVHKPSANGDRVYANVKSVVAMPKGIPAPEVDRSTFVFFDSQATGSAYSEALAKVPEYLRKKYESRLPDEASGDGAAGPDPAGQPQYDDDIPF
jgi:hypothetical protein